MAVGWYAPVATAAAGAAGGVERLPRARPEPRVVPNPPNGTVESVAAGVGAEISAVGAGADGVGADAGSLGAALEAPDDS
jgi:hypothetical protein